MTTTLLALLEVFLPLSLVAFGGGNTVLPDIARQVVTVHHWASARDFSSMFALAQSAPGPNLMIVPLVGWHVAGPLGVLVTSVAKFGPSSLIAAAGVVAWDRFKDSPWRRRMQAGIVPVTAGLVAASAITITEASATTWLLASVAALCAVLATTTKLHPLLLLGGGALLGLASYLW